MELITRKSLLDKTLAWIRGSEGYTKLFKDELDRLDALGRPPLLTDLRDLTIISWTWPFCAFCMENKEVVVKLGNVSCEGCSEMHILICPECMKKAQSLLSQKYLT